MIDFPENLSCPMPILDQNTIQMAHGAGGRLSADLIEKLFLPRFGEQSADTLEDQAVVDFPYHRLAVSTDSFVVDPIEFPGGNIGDLAINGTVNDVAMSGAMPLFLTVGFILEEGLPLAVLHRILLSMESAAAVAGVKIITGDTKVVNRGHCDKIFINTTGIGAVPDGIHLSSAHLKPGDQLILSGTLADHGMAIMTTRKELSFSTQVLSDSAALNHMTAEILGVTNQISAMRDPTRGGLATSLNEFARSSKVGIQIYEDRIPVKPDVNAACEILGIDPLYVANEGKLIVSVPEKYAPEVLKTIRACKFGGNAVIIGEVTSEHPGGVVMKTGLGVNRIIDMPVGEQLPRIC